MGVQHRLLAGRGHMVQRLRGHRGAVADAAAQQHDVVCPADHDLAPEHADHAGAPTPAPASARASGARLTWQIATASASAAWSGAGGESKPSSAATMRATCSLSARPLPQTEDLTACGV